MADGRWSVAQTNAAGGVASGGIDRQDGSDHGTAKVLESDPVRPPASVTVKTTVRLLAFSYCTVSWTPVPNSRPPGPFQR